MTYISLNLKVGKKRLIYSLSLFIKRKRKEERFTNYLPFVEYHVRNFMKLENFQMFDEINGLKLWSYKPKYNAISLFASLTI